MRKVFILVGVLLMLSSIVLISCNDSTKSEVLFSGDIQPVFNNNCISCHGPGGSANLDLTSYNAMTNGENDNPDKLIVPFNADQSLLYEKIAMETPSIGVRMPMGSNPLSISEIKMVEDWINAGAKDN